MERFKKRTIALVLASVVTVVGAFGAENYKNSLMSLEYENQSNGAVNLTVLTKHNYTNNLTPIKKDASTYVIMLPETNSEISEMPAISGNIESIDVKTMPYTKTSRGYTKITVKTIPNTGLTAKKALYIPQKNIEVETPPPQQEPQNTEPQTPEPQLPVGGQGSNRIEDIARPAQTNADSRQHTNQPVQVVLTPQSSPKSDIQPALQDNIETPKEPEPQVEPAQDTSEEVSPQKSAVSNEDFSQTTEHQSSELTLILLGVLLAIIISVFFVLKAKDKMLEITGESTKFDIDDEPKKKEKKKPDRQKIRNTIKTLDKMYTKPVKMPVNTPAEENIAPDEAAEQQNVYVDLDELFQQSTQQASENNTEAADDENSALDEFLNAYFSDEEDMPAEQIVEEDSFNKELYEKYINDENLRFSKDDIECINKLLNNEISDDTMRNISKFVVSTPVEEKKPSRTEILENFVTAYTIRQNITFTHDDVEALYKLISVEIDKDFLTDLKTNPHRMEEMRQEITRPKPHKTSEILTLNVKDMLPDLSEALKRQGGRRIESEVKPQVVYYSEGYEVSKLKLDYSLPDLASELNNDEAYKSRPSDEIQLVETGYDVEKMSVSDGELPDLADVLKNPEKYNTPKEEPVVIDEDALLKNISNVTFKPFYDESREFEVVNNFDDSKAPSVSDMQAEFNQISGGFEIINEDEDDNNQPQDNSNVVDDFESLYDDHYVDFDKGIEAIKEQELPKFERKIPAKASKLSPDAEAQKLIQEIEKKRTEQKSRLENAKPQEVKPREPVKREQSVKSEVSAPKQDTTNNVSAKKCMYNGVEYSIIGSANFSENMGCYLVNAENGYNILGFIGGRTFELKNYESLPNTRLQARISEKLDDGSARYIIRIGMHKFIMNVNNENNTMEFIMDLC